jgi:hypothetical protein
MSELKPEARRTDPEDGPAPGTPRLVFAVELKPEARQTDPEIVPAWAGSE